MNITDQELLSLSSCTTYQQYRAACNAIKTARRGLYPPDWWEKTQTSGLAKAILARFEIENIIIIDKFVATYPANTNEGEEEFFNWMAQGTGKPHIKRE